MNVTSKISVDLTRQCIGGRVNAVQGDGNTRYVEITLLAGGAPWTPPEGVEAAIAYMQPSGTKGMYNLLADGTAAISINGDVATIVLAPQMLTVSGTVQASLVFNDAALNQLTTFPFSVSVVSNPAAGAQKTEDYIRLRWLNSKLEEQLKIAKDSGEFDGPKGDPFTYDDFTPEQLAALTGPQGPAGDNSAALAAADAANTAADAANQAAESAASAANNANSSAQAANYAADSANTAATLANSARDAANATATYANNAAATANEAARDASDAAAGANDARDRANEAANTVAPDVAALKLLGLTVVDGCVCQTYVEG